MEKGVAQPWNWCRVCKQPVDIDEETFDGSEVKCVGCRRILTVVHLGGDRWTLICHRQNAKKWREHRKMQAAIREATEEAVMLLAKSCDCKSPVCYRCQALASLRKARGE